MVNNFKGKGTISGKKNFNNFSIKRIFKRIGLSILVIIVLIIFSGILFMNFSPQFGKGLSEQQKKEFKNLPNYKNEKFQNQHPSPMDINFWNILKKLTTKNPNSRPHKDLEVIKINNFENNVPKLTWFGHSTFLLELEKKKILIDPMFSQSPSPISLFGPKRYSKDLPTTIEDLPQIDAVILSHDHYDHLDYETISKLKDKTRKFFVPLGVDNHLIEWGVPKESITSLNWWENTQFENINLACTPARHFSGRGLFDRANTLWCSWVIKGKMFNVFFSGDSGYDSHFKEIGNKYGPFDIALLECGQYNVDWKLLHMMPEETAQAGVDLNSKLIVPIHWGAFTLAFHDWTDPVERVILKANELNIPVATPRIGETIILGNEKYPSEKWWIDIFNKSNQAP